MTEIITRPEADADLIEIWIYIAEDSSSAADRLLDRINNIYQIVAENPMMGQSREHLAPGLRSFPMGNYLIFYRPVENGIEIVRVLNASRDIGSLF